MRERVAKGEGGVGLAVGSTLPYAPKVYTRRRCLVPIIKRAMCARRQWLKNVMCVCC